MAPSLASASEVIVLAGNRQLLRKAFAFERMGAKAGSNAGGTDFLKATSGSLREQVPGKPVHPAG